MGFLQIVKGYFESLSYNKSLWASMKNLWGFFMDYMKYGKTKRIGSNLSNFIFAAIFIKHTGGCYEKLCELRGKGRFSTFPQQKIIYDWAKLIFNIKPIMISLNNRFQSLSLVYQHMYLTHLFLETSTNNWIFHHLSDRSSALRVKILPFILIIVTNLKMAVTETVVKDCLWFLFTPYTWKQSVRKEFCCCFFFILS